MRLVFDILNRYADERDDFDCKENDDFDQQDRVQNRKNNIHSKSPCCANSFCGRIKRKPFQSMDFYRFTCDCYDLDVYRNRQVSRIFVMLIPSEIPLTKTAI